MTEPLRAEFIHRVVPRSVRHESFGAVVLEAQGVLPSAWPRLRPSPPPPHRSWRPSLSHRPCYPRRRCTGRGGC
jgi:hypothetical protein